MAKTFMEMSTDIVTAMVNRGVLKVDRVKDETVAQFNKKAVRTVGWAMLEMYKEISRMPGRAWKELDEKGEKQAAGMAKKQSLIIPGR